MATSLTLAALVGWQEIVLILLVVLLLFGGRKLPDMARGLGKGLREFKKAVHGMQDEIEDAGRAADSAPQEPQPYDEEGRPRDQDSPSST